LKQRQDKQKKKELFFNPELNKEAQSAFMIKIDKLRHVLKVNRGDGIHIMWPP
jgi:hypothetical protein